MIVSIDMNNSHGSKGYLSITIFGMLQFISNSLMFHFNFKSASCFSIIFTRFHISVFFSPRSGGHHYSQRFVWKSRRYFLKQWYLEKSKIIQNRLTITLKTVLSKFFQFHTAHHLLTRFWWYFWNYRLKIWSTKKVFFHKT